MCKNSLVGVWTGLRTSYIFIFTSVLITWGMYMRQWAWEEGFPMWDDDVDGQVLSASKFKFVMIILTENLSLGPRKFINMREYFTTRGTYLKRCECWTVLLYYFTLTTSKSLLTSNMVMFLLVLFFCSSVINTVGKVLSQFLY